MISLSEPFAEAITRLSRIRDVDYPQENPPIDNFDELLAMSNLRDVQGRLSFWQDEHFERGRGYTDITSYRLKCTDKWSPGLSTLDLMPKIGFRSFVDMATTRELICFYLTNKKMVDRRLSQGESIVALGRDCFNLGGDTTPMICHNELGLKILDFVSLSKALWFPHHLFLVRSSRSR